MKKYYLIFMIFIVSFVNQAQTVTETEYEFFPNDLIIHPFTANQLEPKLGFVFRMNSNQLWLNIGNSMDLIRIKRDSEIFSIGADLFTWTLLKKEDNFRFPVDAVDYMFGLNFGFKTAVHNYSFGGRIRLSHISAHFVDGHFDKDKQQWKDGMDPRVFSREFVEVLGFYSFNNIRVYLGGTYLYHVEPSGIGKASVQAGLEYFMKDALSYNISPYIAADGTMKTNDKKRNFTLNAGIKFGKIEGRGLRIFYQYYNGYDINGEYFDVKREHSTLGINLDL
ncbi:MAG: DUF1207 domain-containing protein [Ignavibacteriales bacterium]|nr:DUF1207 domain-containing protein [Ignavibacteriales bacterium]